MAAPAHDNRDGRRRFQFSIFTLLAGAVLTAVATRQVLSPDWAAPERWILGAALASWILGAVWGRALGSRGILSAAALATIGGGAAALACYFFLFVDELQRRRLPFREEVVYPILTLLSLILAGAVALAILWHAITILAGRVRQAAQRRRAVRIAIAGCLSLIAGAWWIAFFLAWRPDRRLDIHDVFDGSGPAVAFSNAPGQLALGSSQGLLQLRDLPSLAPGARHRSDLVNGVWHLQFSRDGRRLECASLFDSRIPVIDAGSGERLAEVNVPGGVVVALGGDAESLVALFSRGGRLGAAVWRRSDWTKTAEHELDAPGWAPVANVERRLLAYLSRVDGVSGPSRISLHDLNTGAPLATGPLIDQATSHFKPTISTDGQWIAMFDTAWNPETGESFRVPGHAMAFLPGSHRLITIETELLDAWRPLAATPEWLLQTPLIRRLLWPRERSRILIYDVSTKRVVRRSIQQTGRALAWLSPDGARLATLGSRAELQLWSVPSRGADRP